jgi:hypothetical protein
MGGDEVWQSIPDEWLTPSKIRAGAASSAKKSAVKQTPNGKGKGRETSKRKTGLESDTDESELSELSDDEQVEADSRSKDGADGPASSELSAEPEEPTIVDGDGGQASRKSTPLSEAGERTPEPSQTLPSPDAEQPMNGVEEESTLVEAEPEKTPVEVENDTAPAEPVTGIETAVASTPEISSLVEDKMDVVEEPSRPANEQSMSPAAVLAESDAGAALDAAMDNVTASLEQPALTAGQTAEQNARPKSPPVDGQTLDILQPVEEATGPAVAEENPVEAETPAIETPVTTTAEDAPVAAGTSAVKEEEEEEEDPDDEVLLAAKKALNPGFLEWECVSYECSPGR